MIHCKQYSKGKTIMEKRKPRQLYSKLFWTYTVIVLVIVSALTVYFITVSRKNVLESNREERERINTSCADYIDEMSKRADYFYKDLYRSRSKLDDLLAYMELDSEAYQRYYLDRYSETGDLVYEGILDFLAKAFEACDELEKVEIVSYTDFRMTECRSEKIIYPGRDGKTRLEKLQNGDQEQDGRLVYIKQVNRTDNMENVGCMIFTFEGEKAFQKGVRKRVTDAEGEIYDVKELFDAYVRFGGMPMLADVGLEIDRVTAALDGVYSAAVVNDILEREKRKGRRSITDPILLKKIILFLADNIGNNTSATSVGNTLAGERLLEKGGRRAKPAVQTVQAYIEALTEAYIFYEIRRFDIKGKEYLRTLGKYYIVDIGLRNYLLGYRDGDSGHILENIIYFELLRRGYDVAIGKIDSQEVDFIAAKADDKKYIQVTESMNAPETRERELAPLRKIRDSFEKIVIALECDLTRTQDGIKIIKALDFLLE